MGAFIQSLEGIMNAFQLIYALIALTMIKATEKFIRDMFGVNGKVAGTASHESGKAFMDATAKFVKDAATVVATVATGGVSALASQKGVEQLMNLKSGADGFANSLSSGVADAGAKDGFFSQQVKDWNKKRTDNTIEDTAANKESINILTEKLYREKYKGMYNNEQRERDAAEAAAKAKLKSLSSKYVPYGITDFNTMMELDKISKETGMTNTEKIIAEYRKRNGDTGFVQDLERMGMEKDKIRITAKLMSELKEKLKNDGDTFIVVGEDGKGTTLTKKDLSSGEALKAMKAKAKYIVESGNAKKKITPETLEDLNNKARNNSDIYNTFKEQVCVEMELRGGKYEIIGKNGIMLEVTKENINSDEVKEAIMSKFKYLEGINDIETSIDTNNIDFDSCNSLQLVNGNLGKKASLDDVSNLNERIEELRKMTSEEARNFEIQMDDTLNEEAKKFIATEIERRNKEEAKVANTGQIVNQMKDILSLYGEQAITVGNETEFSVNASNLNSPEVQRALLSKIQFIEGIDDVNKLVNVRSIDFTKFEELEKLDRTRARLEDSTGKELKVSTVRNFDKIIESYRNAKNTHPGTERSIIQALNGDLKQVVIDEVTVRG